MLLAVLVLAWLSFVQAHIDWPKDFQVKPVVPFHSLPRVVGSNVAMPNQFPHQVALWIDGLRFCSGSIISTKTIITAARCLHRAKYAVVIAGVHNIAVDGSEESEKSRQVFLSKQLIPHEGWDPQKPGINDIALVIIADNLQLNQPLLVDKIERYTGECPDTTLEGTFATVSGWGRTSDSSNMSTILRYAAGEIISNKECDSNYGNILDNHVCLNGKKLAGPCKGDSGGPLTLYDYNDPDKAYLVGIVSFGSSWGCKEGFPTVFTRVSCFKDWIDGHIEPKA